MHRNLVSKILTYNLLPVLAILAGCVSQEAVSTADAKTEQRSVTVSVDISKSLGPLPYIFRTSSFLWYLPEPESNKAFDKLLSEHKIGTIAIKLDTVLEISENYEDLLQKLSLWDDTVRKIVDNGGEVAFEIWGMPLWLTSNRLNKPDTATFENKAISFKSPPHDYKEWARIVYAIVDHFNNKLKIDGKYQIWAEPDIHWLGKEEEYLKLYKYSVLGARKADPKAKIGGPATSAWNARSLRFKSELTGNPMIYNFIEYCSKTPLPELGLLRLPIDFVAWHQFNMNPFIFKSLAEPINQIRKWLRQFGYDMQTELFLGEWNTWQETGKEHGYFSPEHDTNFAAAYIVATLDAMNRHGLDRQAFSVIFEFGVPGKEFAGNFGMFTKRKIIKPAYNAFAAVGILEYNLVETSVDDAFLVPIGTSGEETVVLLLANFFPVGKMASDIVIPRNTPRLPIFEHEYTPEEIAREGITKDMISKMLAGDLSVEKVKMSAHMREYFRKVVSVAEGIKKTMKKTSSELWRSEKPVSVRVRFNNIPFKNRFRYQRYLIDSGHSNSYAVRKKAEEALKQGVSADIINRWSEIKLQEVETRMEKAAGEYTSDFVMNPYSVTVIILSSN